MRTFTLAWQLIEYPRSTFAVTSRLTESELRPAGWNRLLPNRSLFRFRRMSFSAKRGLPRDGSSLGPGYLSCRPALYHRGWSHDLRKRNMALLHRDVGHVVGGGLIVVSSPSVIADCQLSKSLGFRLDYGTKAVQRQADSVSIVEPVNLRTLI